MNIGEYIKTKRIERKLTLEELGNLVGVGKSTVRKWENGMIKNIKRDKISLLAKALDISPLNLLGMNEEDEDIYSKAGIDFIRVPLYSTLSCGTGGFVEDNIIEYVPVPSKDLKENREYFCQIADGDSMINAGIDNGDLLVFEKTSSIGVGSIGCFCIDENIATCKKYTVKNNVIMLMPMNTDYEPIIIDAINDGFKVLGLLRLCVKRYE